MSTGKQPGHGQQKFKTQLGIDATVQREDVRGDDVARANRDLLMMGSELNPRAENLTHLGSAAFHVYYNETLKQVYFVEQAGPTLAQCPEGLAMAATKSFIGTIMESFGHKRPKLRSNF